MLVNLRNGFKWGLVLAVFVTPPTGYAVDAMALIDTDLCSKTSIPLEIARSAAYFEFKRSDGFLCARRVLDALVSDISIEPQDRLHSSQLFWVLFLESVRTTESVADFKKIATEIRMSENHPLKSQARLAMMRLDVLATPSKIFSRTQVVQVLADFQYFSAPLKFGELYAAAPAPLRESLQWLVLTYFRMLLSAPLELDAGHRLLATSSLGEQFVYLGAANPSLLRYIVSSLWRDGRLILTKPQALTPPIYSASYPEMSMVLAYDVCADNDCTNAPGITTGSISDQSITQRHSFDHTNSEAFLRYGFGSWPVISTICDRSSEDCTPSDKTLETGRSYTIGAISFARGGARYLTPILKDVGGREDMKAHVNYTIKGKIIIPQCLSPGDCDVHVTMRVNTINDGPSKNTSFVVSVKGPTAETPTLAGSITSLDLSKGSYEISVEMGRNFSDLGAAAQAANYAAIEVRLERATPNIDAAIKKFSERITGADQRLLDLLPVYFAANALALTPANLGNAVPQYFGLGEALTQYSRADFSKRWERIYLPLLYLSVINNRVGPDLSTSERESVNLARANLSAQAKSQFQDAAAQQAKFISALVPALNVAPIDSAITSIQKENSLESSISPLLKDFIALEQFSDVSMSNELGSARENIRAAATKDNLLEAVLLLYEARAKMQSAIQRASEELSVLSVEQTGFSLVEEK